MARKDNKGRNLKTGEYQRPDGRYEYRYKDEITGKRNSVYAADLVSLREMEKKINKDMDDLLITDASVKKLTVNTLFERYMATKNIKERTKKNYIRMWDYRIRNTLGNIRVVDFKTSHVRMFFSALSDEGLAHSTICLLYTSKEQLKKLGGMEFYDVNFSYIDLEDMSEHYVSVPEQGGGKLIPDGMCNPGQVYTVSRGKSGMIGVFRLESQMLPGNGKIERTGLGSDSKCKEAVNTAFNYLKANGNRISGSISTSTKDYIINYQDLQGIGMTDKLALPTLIALCSIALGKPVVSNLAVLGDITISGTMIKVDELANTLQVCLDSGAKKVLIPSTSFVDFASVPADLMSAFQLIPYQSAEDAVFKALGVE